jgi:hypothetical protein
MDEDEKQEKFREEVREFLARDKLTLDNLVMRVDKLEKTVVHGNGDPPLTTQIAAMQVQMNNFRDELKEVKDKMGKLDQMCVDVASINAKLTARASSNGMWIWAIITVGAVVLTPILEHFLFGK